MSVDALKLKENTLIPWLPYNNGKGLYVLWGQRIKLIQVASNSEFRENQWKDHLFFEIVPSHCFGA